MESGRFDPRFDPAFQPGYTTEDAAGLTLSNGPAIARAGTARAAAPTNGAVPVVLPPTNSGTASSIGIEPMGEAETSNTGQSASAPVTPVPRRTNPFIIALAVISVALIGGGFYIVTRLQENFAGTQTNRNLDYVSLQVLAIGAPVVICLGLATGISAVVVSAIGWDRRRG